ncbi:MAG TPA: hypothetical protein VG477_13245 [Thermoanaerobaculia bacterium]|nr:hypothetical protein [Thermoanaerobaculia bacterium]
MLRSTLFATAVLTLLAAPLSADGPRWVPLGPGGGTVASLALHPANPNVLYAATGGVAYKSVDAGAFWVELSGPGGVLQVALDPSRPTTVYALAPNRVFKSVNGGATWTSSAPAGPPPFDPLRTLAVDPAQPSRLYVSAAGGVWRSDNGGLTWQQASRGVPVSEITGLAVPRRPSGTAFAGTASGLYRTTNAGRSWTRLDLGLLAERVLAVAVSPSDPRTVYASLEHGLFLSRDGGAAWTEATAPDNVPPSVLAVHPRVPRTLFANGRSGIVKSTDFARSWTPIGPSPGVDVLAIAVHSGRSGDVLYLGLNPQGLDTGGVLVSSDGGGRWMVRNRGLHELEATDVAADSEGALLAGMTGQGLFRRINPRFPPIWARTSAGAPFTQEFVTVGEIVNAGPGIFLATVFSDLQTTFPLQRTTDGGRTWSRVDALQDPIALAADPDEAGTAYALTNQGFFRTVDAGASWTPLTRPPLDCPFRNLAVAPSSPLGARVLYAVGSGASASSCGFPLRAFRSNDGGASWVDVSAGLPVLDFAGPLAVDPLDANVVYMGFGASGNRELNLWKSVDGATTWTRTDAPRGRVHDIVVPPIPGRVYAAIGSQARVFRSDDGGATWRRWNEGLPTQIQDLALDPGDPGRLYAATSRGVWVLEEED